MIDDKVIKEIHRENLCTYFVLPLLKLNKQSYAGGANFIDSYLTRDLNSLFVEIVEIAFVEHRILVHPHFEKIWKKGERYMIEYRLPQKWKHDAGLVVEGKFSKISREAKEIIVKNSGLQYRQRDPPNRIPFTDIRLLALEKSKAVREMWEDQYDVVLDEDDELLSKPTDRIFIDVSLLREQS